MTLPLLVTLRMLLLACPGAGFGSIFQGAAQTRASSRDHGISYPEIGVWYRRENGTLFEVVALDEEDGTIGIQHFDATIEEVELDRWPKLRLESAVAPEDWSGSVDVDIEDLPECETPRKETLQTQLIILDRFE